ncbi:MAG: type II secretion system minor pseudopilin GspK [Gammaproteobacteria bacterium]|nr:type II secretion system minor pseudopilin GspK [Gammaproteobacteria bacterium]
MMGQKAMNHRRRQSGVALITALLITALVTVAAVSMASRQQLDIRRTGNLMEADQAWQYALGVEAWARQVLAADDHTRDTLDYLKDPWAAAVPSLPVEGGSVQGTVEDLQGRFNLNNLVDASGKPVPAQEKILQNLLERVAATDAKLSLGPSLADVVVDWLDAEPGVYRSGAEDGDYLNMEPVPYRAANRPMVSPSEMLALAGFSVRAVAKLTPLVATLPGPTTLNVNTAPEMVLISLDTKLTPPMAQQVVAYRKKTPFDSAADFTQYMQSEFGVTVDPKLVDVKSEYFLTNALATIGRTNVQLYSLLKRSNNKVTTLQRSIGVY